MVAYLRFMKFRSSRRAHLNDKAIVASSGSELVMVDILHHNGLLGNQQRLHDMSEAKDQGGSSRQALDYCPQANLVPSATKGNRRAPTARNQRDTVLVMKQPSFEIRRSWQNKSQDQIGGGSKTPSR